VIYPDYVGVTVPASIAPLNFTIKAEKFDLIYVEVTGKIKGSIHVQDKEMIQFSENEWHQLLADNKGEKLNVVVSLKLNGIWKQYRSFSISISSYALDYGLVCI